jgi:hypothetical protein
MGNGQKINKGLWCGLLMLLLWISYIGEVSLFPHNHIVDGHRITHSHPYSGSPENPNHNHTQAQIATIAMLSNVVAIVALGTFALGLSLALLTIIGYAAHSSISYLTKQILSLRAPPVALA